MSQHRRNATAKARSRPAVGTERLLNCLLAGDDAGNTTTALRIQRLASISGITGTRAQLIAGLAWGEVQHG
jgi:hypothetical protein